MSSIELPSRAKPEALHTICRHLKRVDRVEKTRLYDELEIDRRQIRASVDYGSKLGFLETQGDTVTLADRGRVISYNESLEESAVRDVFQEAIESFEPYREALLRIHARESVEEVSGEPCILQSTFKAGMREITGDDASNREINLFIKTLQAAGFGEFITGRRGKETRLQINEKLDDYLSYLANEYDMPEPQPRNEQKRAAEEEATNQDGMLKGAEIRAGMDTEELELSLTVDVSDKSGEEIARIVENIRKGEI